MRRILVALCVVGLTACPKAENAGGGTGTGSTPSGGATSSTTPVPLASVPPSPAEPAPSPAKSAPSAAASAVAVASAKGKDAGAATPKTARARVEGKNFAIDVTAPSCAVDTDCALTLKLLPAGDFHINKEYPYKFVATPAAGVTFLGKGDPNTFSKSAGDFKEEGEKSATMTVRYKPTSAGGAKVSGTYKFSVCNPDQCQIENQPIALDVPVM
jgi:hypothetical protein